MSRLPGTLAAALMCLAIVSIAGCEIDDTDELTAIGPSPRELTGFVSRGVQVLSPSIHAHRVATSVCPSHPPFIAPVTFFVSAGASDLAFTGVQLQFVDQFGMRESVRTFSHTELVDRFGSTRVSAFDTRKLAFSVPFGCKGAPPGKLAIVVSAADPSGNETTMNVEVPIR